MHHKHVSPGDVHRYTLPRADADLIVGDFVTLSDCRLGVWYVRPTWQCAEGSPKIGMVARKCRAGDEVYIVSKMTDGGIDTMFVLAEGDE